MALRPIAGRNSGKGYRMLRQLHATCPEASFFGMGATFWPAMGGGRHRDGADCPSEALREAAPYERDATAVAPLAPFMLNCVWFEPASIPRDAGIEPGDKRDLLTRGNVDIRAGAGLAGTLVHVEEAR